MPLTRTGKWAVIYGVVAIEVAALTGSYYVWNKLNMSQGEGYKHTNECTADQLPSLLRLPEMDA